MGLPGINIRYLNGQLGTVPESQDGLLALAVIGATAVPSTFTLGSAYLIYRATGLTDLGVTEENNARLVELVSQFYSEAPEGTPLVVVGYESTDTMTALCDKTAGKLKALLELQDGDLRGIVLATVEDSDDDATEGLDADVFTALAKGQELAEYAASELYAPIFIAFEGAGYKDSASLKDLSEETYNRCCVIIGDVTSGSKHAAMGTFGRREPDPSTDVYRDKDCRVCKGRYHHHIWEGIYNPAHICGKDRIFLDRRPDGMRGD